MQRIALVIFSSHGMDQFLIDLVMVPANSAKFCSFDEDLTSDENYMYKTLIIIVPLGQEEQAPVAIQHRTVIRLEIKQ
jgi:hypothetical protein